MWKRAPPGPAKVRQLNEHALPNNLCCLAAGAADPSGCIKVVTTTGTYNSGYVTVFIDEGKGFKAATPSGDSSIKYVKGATVLDQCYANLKAVQMQGTDPDAWGGTVEFARDKTGPYTAGVCTTCTAGEAASAAEFGFEGPVPGGTQLMAKALCTSGKKCDIEFSFPERTTTG